MLFIMRGVSCSGKDSFIEDNFPNKNHVLSSDDFREMMLGDRSSQQYNKKVFETMYDVLETRFQNRVHWTVLNATNLRMKDSNKAIDLAKKYRVPVTIISIVPPSLDVLCERNQIRFLETGFHVPENVLEKHINRYEVCKDQFIKEALYNDLCCFIEIDQDWKVVKHVA